MIAAKVPSSWRYPHENDINDIYRCIPESVDMISPIALS
jgi:hypothetical protein